MKKITIIVALLCSISAFSATRYLVELGTGGAATWRTAGLNEKNVNLTTLGVTLNAWVTDRNLATPTLGSPAGSTFAANDEIWIAGGIYTVSGVISLKADVSIYGSFAGTETAASQRLKNSTTAWDFTSQTVIDGNSGNYRGVTTNPSVTSCIIDGVQIKNFTVTAGTTYGVGAYLQTKCTMQNCIVSNNSYTGTTGNYCKGVGVQLKSATVLSAKLLDSYIHHNTNTTGSGSGATGGGVAIWGSATVKGCTIASNSATSQGGGIVLSGDYTNTGYCSGGNIENCIISNNSSTAYGAGITCQNTGFKTENVTIKNCQIIENTAPYAAGAFLNPYSTVAISIDGCLFSGNVVNGNGASTGFGAALYLFTGDYTTYPIKNCIFRDNSAGTTTATAYGSIFHAAVIATMQNCVFANNTASGTSLSIAKFFITGSKVYNCTFAKNLTNGSGRALNFSSNATPAAVCTATNCLFWGNISATNCIGAIGTSTATYIAQDGGTAPSGAGNRTDLNSATNNTFTSPISLQGASTDATTKAQVAGADWSLKSGCPAINNGTDLSGSGVTTDILGNTRPTGASKVDIGAYEVLNVADYTDNTNTNINISSSSHLIVNTSKTFGAVTIAPGGKLTLNDGSSLSVTSLNLQSNATNGTATFVNANASGNFTGTSTVNQSFQHPAGALRTWYVTPPVTTAIPTGMQYIKSYDEPTFTWSSSLTTMNAKVGYQVVPAAAINDISFTGTLNNGNQDITLTSRSGTDNKAGFNLIGNPYPSYLDWSLVTNPSNTAVMRSTTMWYRTKKLNQSSQLVYQFWTVNGDGVSSPNGASSKIPPMQAFWVRANAGGGTLALTNAMRSHAPDTDKLLKAPAAKNTTNTLVRLQVSNGTNTDEAVLYFSANASNEMDVYDSPKMNNENVAIPEIYTTLGTEQIVINGMNTIPLDTPIGLGFVAGNATSFSLTANEVSNLPTGVKLILKDNVTTAETDLTDGVATYQFSPTTTSSDRFSVIFRTPGAVTDLKNTLDNSILVYNNAPQQLTVICNDMLNVGSIVTVYNAIGQKLMSQQLTGTSTQIAGKYIPGVYVVKVNNTTKKVIIN